MSDSTLHTLHSALYVDIPHATLYSTHSTLYTLHSTLDIPHLSLDTPHFTLYISHSTLAAAGWTSIKFSSPCVLTFVPVTYMWTFGLGGCILFPEHMSGEFDIDPWAASRTGAWWWKLRFTPEPGKPKALNFLVILGTKKPWCCFFFAKECIHA